MKKFLLTLIVTMLACVGVWAQGTQASKSVYKFTDKAAAGGLYTDDHGTPASVTSGAVCNQNYFVKSEYKKADSDPSTESITGFGVKTYYVKDADSYTCAYGTVYNDANTYATVSETELTGDALNEKLTGVYRFTKDSETWVYGCNKTWNDYGYWEYSSTGVHVNEGDICNPEEYYYANGGNTGNTLIGWGAAVASKSFSSTEGIFIKVDGIYQPLTTNDYDSDEHYYTLEFSDLSDADEAAMADNATNFATVTTLTGLSDPSGIYYYNGVTYTEANNGDVYHADCYYTKEVSYSEKTPAELYALGYVSAETTYYDCDIEENIAESTLTITANPSYATYRTFIQFIQDNQEYISQFKTVEIKSEAQNDGSNLAAIFAAIQPCSGVLNLILNEVANYGYDPSKDEIKLSNLIGTSIKRIVLPKCATWNDDGINKVVKNDNEGTPIVPVVQGYNTSTTDFTVHTYVAGSLKDIAAYHYTTDEVKNAYWIEFTGNLNEDDLDFINDVQTGKINMMSATVADKDAFASKLSTFNNANVKYIGLPDLGVNKPANDLVDALYDNCEELIGVGHVNATDASFYGSIRDTKDAGGNTVHNEGTLMILSGHSLVGEHVGMASVILSNAYTKEIHLAGDLNAKDITNIPATETIGTKKDVNGVQEVNDAYLSNSGHWVTTEDAEKSTKQYGAFGGMYNCEVLDFTDAKFEENADLNPRIAGILSSATTKVLLPIDASFTTIPHFAFNNTGDDLKSFIIPGNIKDLGDYAFYDDGNIHRITTTKVDGNGNGSYAEEDIIDNGEFTMTLPAGLEHIGTSCFWNDGRFTDVYVLATIAPACERDAFDSNSYTGNNGFDGSNGVNQGAYCHTDALTFAVLHYPSSLYGTDEEKKYTDPTRVYTLEDNDHKTDANGNLLHWPSQAEWNHAYVTATTGTLWDAWSQDVTVANTWTFASNLTYDDVKAVVGEVDDQYKYTDYIGWHQFILANRLNSAKDKDVPTRDYSRFKENDWYTICVPYNLRKSDLLKIFGAEYSEYPGTTITTLDGNSKTVNADVYPEVRTLIGVTRNEATGQITLKMSKDLTENENCLSTIPSGGAAPSYSTYADPDPIVIKEGYPYIIRPYLPADKKELANAGQYLVQVEETGEHIENNGVRVPFTSHIITALDGSSNVLDDWTYQFVGSYTTHKLPAYSYYMSKSKSKQKNIWFYFQPAGYNINATSEADKAANEAKLTKTWNPYGSIIAAKPSVSIFIPTSDQAKEGMTPSMSFQGDDDSFGEVGAKSSNYAMVFDEDSATGINEVGNNKVVNSNVYYNLNGQSVGSSAENIPAGIYIINGKKVVVK